MNNIFEGAKFGDKFLTRDGKIAIFDTELTIAPYVYLLIECEHNLIEYDYEGICQINGASYYDIISRYQEPIDEKELDELAWYEAFKKYDIHSETENIIQHRDGFTEGFKAGW